MLLRCSAVTTYERITAHDGGTFDAYCARPPGGSGPGVVLFQEIFGINDNMRGIADRLATDGYMVLVPDMFWRLEPRFERKDESGLEDAFAMVQRFDFGDGALDSQSTHVHLLGMVECTGRVGALGFCLGGTLAFSGAARSRVDGRGLDAAVSYYGSGNLDLLPLLDQVPCPMLFHYGNEDPFIPAEHISAVEAAIAPRADMVLHRYDAGHAFGNWDAPSMYRPEAAELAWQRTTDFLAAHLG
jgi:carboxymethylenebutenolidase